MNRFCIIQPAFPAHVKRAPVDGDHVLIEGCECEGWKKSFHHSLAKNQMVGTFPKYQPQPSSMYLPSPVGFGSGRTSLVLPFIRSEFRKKPTLMLETGSSGRLETRYCCFDSLGGCCYGWRRGSCCHCCCSTSPHEPLGL